MSIESIQKDVKNWRGPDARGVEATLEVARQLQRIADTLEEVTSPKVMEMLERWATPPMQIQVDDIDLPMGAGEPRIAEAECDKCGYRQSYYPEDGPIPYGWGFISKVQQKGGVPMAHESLGVCQDCLSAVRDGRDKSWKVRK